MFDEDQRYAHADHENLRRVHLVHASLDETILRNIANAIAHQYGRKEIAEGVTRLGAGDGQTAFGIGRIRIPDRKELYLCLKLSKGLPYVIHNRRIESLEEQVVGLNEACISYEIGKPIHPNILSRCPNKKLCLLYFFGLISWGEGNYGILTEDISHAKKHPLEEIYPSEFATRMQGGVAETFFIDPMMLRHGAVSRQVLDEYLKQEHVLRIPDEYVSKV